MSTPRPDYGALLAVPVEEAAKILAVNRVTIWRLWKRGKLKKTPQGRITTKSLHAYVRDHER